jgi:hypothetical protein
VAALSLLAGLVLLAVALAVHFLVIETPWWLVAAAAAGVVAAAGGAWGLRAELAGLLRRRRGEVALHTAGVVGLFLALAYFSLRYPGRFDVTESGRYSLSPAAVTMLSRLERPVHVVFFADPLMRETVELYQLMARQTPKLTLEVHDPMLNPAPARLLGVQFAGTAVMESEGRRLQVNSGSETDIANGILRVSRSTTQRLCFLDGHGEPDPFSIESHDHLEGAPGHSHGLGARYVLHERHGMAKARQALETRNYSVEKVSLLQGGAAPLAPCALLVVAGPKVPLLPPEVSAVRAYLAAGGHGLFMLDPFVTTGLEPVLAEFGIVVEDDIVVDEGSHFWADPSSPAVSDHNRHQVTRELPLTFFPGARSLSPTPVRVPGASVVPLANSSRRSWGQRSRDRIAAGERSERPGPRTIMVVGVRRPVTAEGAEALRLRPDQPLARPPAGVTGTSRIAVVGDSDFATNSFFHIMGNGTLFLNTVSFLVAEENLIGIPPRTHDLPRVNLTNQQVKGTFLLSIVLVPAVLTVVGVATWWRQR